MRNLYFVFVVVFSNVLRAELSEPSDDLQKYTNCITAVHEVQGNKNYTLHLTFEQNHPIAVYAPQSFQESQDKQVHRFILPNTQMACASNCDCIQVHQDDVELVMYGVMLLNVVGQDFILMTVAQE